jgi:hypothetical protein
MAHEREIAKQTEAALIALRTSASVLPLLGIEAPVAAINPDTEKKKEKLLKTQ